MATVNDAQGNYALVATRWNRFIVDKLIKGAVDCLHRHGIKDEQITLVNVPGAFEIPLTCEKIAASGKYDAIIALGAVIRGGTPHFEYVSGECVNGLSAASLKHGIPVAFGVLTVDNIQQAEERSCEQDNKGEEATQAAMEMVSLLKQL